MSKEEKITKEDKVYREPNYVKMGLTFFITFVCCVLFFFMILRFQGFASGWSKFFDAAEPIIIGLVLAYLLNPVMHFFEQKSMDILQKKMKNQNKVPKVARCVGVVASILFLVVLICLLIAAIVPASISSIRELVDNMSGNVDKLTKMIQSGMLGKSVIAEYLSSFLYDISIYIEELVTTTLLPQAQKYITQITSGVISVVKSVLNFIIGIIVAVYVMSIKETLIGQSKKIIYAIFSPKYGNVVVDIMRKTNEIFGGFITGKLLDSAIIGCICYIGCCILRMPDAILVSVIIGVTNVIPFFGPIIGAIPCVLLIFIQSPIHALYMFIFVIILQQVDGNIIGPKILGDSTGLSSFWVMFAILVAGGLFGFFGMLLGVPTFAVIYEIIRRTVNYKIRKRKLSGDTKDYIKADHIDEKVNAIVYKS